MRSVRNSCSRRSGAGCVWALVLLAIVGLTTQAKAMPAVAGGGASADDAKTSDAKPADTKIVNRLTVAGSTLDSTLLVKGNKARSETRLPDGKMVRVEECGGSRILHLNDKNRAYFYEQTGEGLQSRATASGGGYVTVVSKTTATGERKQILGRDARHLKTEIHTEPGSAACGENTTLVADGWYVELDAVPQCLTRDLEKILRDRLQTAGCDARLHFQLSGNALSGYPVLLDLTIRETSSSEKNLSPEGSTVHIHQETAEISSVALSDDLFLPPEGYREVNSIQELLAIDSAENHSHAGSDGNPSNGTQPDREPQAAPTAKPKAAGAVRIGVAYPQLDVGNAKILPETIRQQIVAQLQARGLESAPLESQIKPDALKECQPKECDYILFPKISVGRPSVKPGSSGTASRKAMAGVYEARFEFTVVPMSNPARRLEGDNFYDGADVKIAIATVIGQTIQGLKEQLASLK